MKSFQNFIFILIGLLLGFAAILNSWIFHMTSKNKIYHRTKVHSKKYINNNVNPDAFTESSLGTQDRGNKSPKISIFDSRLWVLSSIPILFFFGHTFYTSNFHLLLQYYSSTFLIMLCVISGFALLISLIELGVFDISRIKNLYNNPKINFLGDLCFASILFLCSILLIYTISRWLYLPFVFFSVYSACVF